MFTENELLIKIFDSGFKNFLLLTAELLDKQNKEKLYKEFSLVLLNVIKNDLAYIDRDLFNLY